MKKTLKSLLAIVLTLCLLFSFGLSPAYAAGAKAKAPISDGVSLEDYVSTANVNSTALSMNTNDLLAKIINFISNLLLNGVIFNALASILPRASNTTEVSSIDAYNLDAYENFYSGTSTFLDKKADGAVWSLGYAKESILPHDFGEALYARGSYIPWWYSVEMYKDDDGVTEDLSVRTIILDDGSGRGRVAFCVLDCIGIANSDIRKVRAALSDFAAENNIVSINVSATHTHSGIDSQGVWNSPLSTVANNILSTLSGDFELKNGIGENFLKSIIDGCVNSVIGAVNDLKKGTLTFAKAEISDYLKDRTPPYANDDNLYRLKFMPKDPSATPTIVASFGCHPESSSYDYLNTDDGLEFDTKISADFVYYMDKVMKKAGYNFIFIQGNVGTVTSVRTLSSDGLPNLTAHEGAIRLGYELGYIALSLTMSYAERIELNNSTGDLLGVNTYYYVDGYTPWYDGRVPVTEEVVEPVLNIAHDQFLIEVENNVALTLSKSAIASINLVYDKSSRKYYTITEVGYLEVGDAFKAFISPGELYSELLVGGKGIDGFPYPSLREMYGEDIIIFDLMNDAAGYVTPDNHYVMAGIRYDEEKDSFESDTWCLLVSMGKNTASTLISRFISLVDGVR